MIHYPANNGRFNTIAETKDFIKFSFDHFEDAEALFNLIDKLFPVYNELHPERPESQNAQTFLYGFADVLLTGLREEEESDGA